MRAEGVDGEEALLASFRPVVAGEFQNLTGILPVVEGVGVVPRQMEALWPEVGAGVRRRERLAGDGAVQIDNESSAVEEDDIGGLAVLEEFGIREVIGSQADGDPSFINPRYDGACSVGEVPDDERGRALLPLVPLLGRRMRLKAPEAGEVDLILPAGDVLRAAEALLVQGGAREYSYGFIGV